MIQRRAQPDQVVVAQRRPGGNLRGARQGELDAAPDVATLDAVSLVEQSCQPGRALRLGGRDDRHQVGAPCVEPSPVQHRGQRQRRCGRIRHPPGAAAAVCAVPPADGIDHVHDVRSDQFDLPFGEFLGEQLGPLPIVLGAHPAAGALAVDDDRDRNLGLGNSCHLGEFEQRSGVAVG